ncbi:S1C family serine protease [Paenibacillus glycanilyticus]|uniref:Serine protease YyxA n=1 Tax=Paenibacillus glycanilyticus TaxID=126569 RepID=A0ABQ6GJ96_9BACL|nr:trypsin-like peptidase domain-containing protein [Paenibacillus glycanilyticus]GLX69696.1 putative serine protease YyxA [Paenibacillus glycanilyticus]
MGLFDDDFYSTKVSRRARSTSSRDEFAFSNKKGIRSWSNVQVAFVASFTSAAAVLLLFVLVFGGGGLDIGSSAASVSASGSNSLEQRTIQASAKVRPAVVSVINEQTVPYGLLPDTGKSDGQAEGGTAEEGQLSGSKQEVGVGSGVIYKLKDGKAYIITNNHVIAGAESVKVMLVNGEKREARIVGSDQITDLAVLEMDGKDIKTVAQIGQSSKLQPAEFVLAIGNPLGLGDSLSMGIVSKTHRVVPVSLNEDGVYDWQQEVIQVNVSINEGNSGGPLIDMDGKVVGINSMKIAEVGVEGLGFAIPIDNAMPVIDSLMDKGYVSRPYLGVYTVDLEQYFAQKNMDGQAAAGDGTTEQGQGATPGGEATDLPELNLPDEVFEGVIVLEAVGPAQEAGIKLNDVIVKLDDKSISSTMELRQYLYEEKHIGDEIKVTYYRGGKLKTASFKLAEKTKDE